METVDNLLPKTWIKWNEMNGALCHICAHLGWIGQGLGWKTRQDRARRPWHQSTGKNEAPYWTFINPLTVKLFNWNFFTHLKWVKIIQISQNGGYNIFFKSCWLTSSFILTMFKWNERGFRPPLCTYRQNGDRRTLPCLIAGSQHASKTKHGI